MSHECIFGIDPGTQTGVATYVGGGLLSLKTMTHQEVLSLIRTRLDSSSAAVIFEDSRLQGGFARKGFNAAANFKIMRNVGGVDVKCLEIEAACKSAGVPCFAISPLKKGAKLSAGEFMVAAGWQSRTNQHERDAAMVAWPYRTASYGKLLAKAKQ